MISTRIDKALQLAAAALAFAFTSVAVASETDPPVPAGVDPGGVAVAIIGNGLDYTIDAVAQRLARDGEGEIIGWDFLGNGRRPFKISDDLEDAGYTQRGTAMALTVLKRARTARLVPVLIAADNEISVQRGLAFVAQTPARIAVLSLKNPDVAMWSVVRDAMLGTRILLIVSAEEGAEDRDRIKEHLAPAFDGVVNVIIVAACSRTGGALTIDEGVQTIADVAVNSEAFTMELLTPDTFNWKPESSIAASEVAALAARIIDADPQIEPGKVKSTILALAKPFAADQVPIAKTGWIAEPWLSFRPH